MGITDTQSYSLVIRDVFYDALTLREPFFANHFARKTKMVPIQQNQVPFLGVYIIDETMVPDGDGNAGDIRFIHTLRIGFSVIVANNDQVAAELEIDASFWRIMNRLWTDAHIMNMMNTYDPATGISNPDNTRIESIARGVRRHVYGANALNNQTPLAEMQYDVSCLYRTYWTPIVPDELLEIDVTTKINDNDSIQVQSKYMFDASWARKVKEANLKKGNSDG